MRGCARRTFLLTVGAGALLAPGAALAKASRPATSILGTPAQAEVERLAMRIAASPEVRAQKDIMRQRLAADPMTATPDGKAGVDLAIDRWTMWLILKTIAETRSDFILMSDDSPRTWFGHTFPGATLAATNPDNVYRSAYLDGAARYEIHGRLGANPAGQTTFELRQRPPIGQMQLAKQSASNGDMGGQVKMLASEDLKTNPDGGFLITIDKDPANGRPNHFQTPPGPQEFYVRDSLADWSQSPARLDIRQVGGPRSVPVAEAELIQRVARQTVDFVTFWSAFKNRWLGVPEYNTYAGPYTRAGEWGYSAAGRWRLAPDEALVVTLTTGGASYAAFQVTGPWLVTPDPRRHQISLNKGQSAPNPDSSYTYVMSAKDPGVANWLDPSGLQQGWFQIRWQGFRADPDQSKLMRQFKLVKLADVEAALPAGVPRATPAQRRAQLAQRLASYPTRFAAR